MSTPLAVSCPNCGAGLKLKSKTFVGKKVPCPKCKKPFLVEEPPEDEFLADDDFGGGDDYQEEEEEEEQPRSKKAAKGGKGKKKSKGGGGSGIVLMIGGAVLGVGVLVGVVYGAMALFSGMGGSSGWTAWMPEDTDMVIRVRPAEIANSPFLKPVMDHPTLSKLVNTPAPEGEGDGANALATALNLSVRDIDSITMGGKSFAMGGSNSREFVVVVRTKAAVDSAKLDQATTVITKETYNGKSVYNFNNSNPKMLLYPATPETLVFGTDANVRAAIDRKGAGPGSRFVLSDANAHIFVCAAPNDSSAFKQGATPGSPFNSSFRFGNGTKEARLKSMTFGINLNSDATITMEMNSLDTFDTKVQTDIMKSDIEKVKMELNAAGGGFLDPTAGLKSHVKTMLDGATVNVSGKTATVKMTLPGKIVSDGLALAAPFMPMLEQRVAQQQKAASATAAAPSAAAGMTAPALNGPGGITAYPGAVINAGNNAQNRIDNLGDQHNAALAAQMQEGGAGGHGAPPAGNSGGAVDPAAAMRLQQQATPPAAGGGASSSHGDSSGGGLGGDPAEIMRRQQQAAPVAPGGGASSSHGDSSGGAPGGAPAANPAEAMRRQIAPGAANNSSGDSSGGAANPEEAMRRQMAPGAANNSSGDSSGGAAAGNPEEAMRRQQQAPLAPGGGASSSHGAGGGAPGAAAPPVNPEEAMRRQQQGNPIAPGGAGGGADPAEMMRRQQGGAAGQPGAQGGQNGNGNDPNKPAPRSRSRRRTN